MEEVRRRMGYRFALTNATHDASAHRGEAFTVSLGVRNSGWARLYNARAVEVVLRRETTGAIHRLDASGVDPRTWLPGADTPESLQVTLPADLQAGAYDVLVALPDAGERIRHDSRFAVRFANADDNAKRQGWYAGLGAFALGTTVLVR